MIHTILDTDLYKFTTSYAYIKLFPYAMGTFSFKDRDDTAYTDTFLKELQEAVDSLAQTVLTAEELKSRTICTRPPFTKSPCFLSYPK